MTSRVDVLNSNAINMASRSLGIISTISGILFWTMLVTLFHDASYAASTEDTPESCGRSFVFAFPASHPNVAHNTYVLITTMSTEPVTVTVAAAGIGFYSTSQITRDRLANVTIPSNIIIPRDDTRANKSIIVNADHNVCVYGVCTSGSTADGFTVLPTSVMSTRYVLASYQPLINYRHPAEFVVTALAEETQISMTFNHGGHEPVTKILQPYECYQYIDYTHDLTGTLVTSNKPVSVMSGNECANIPYSTGKCEFLMAHMSGTEEAGRFFVLAPFLGRTSGFIYRVIALHNNTLVNISSLASGPIELSEFAVYEGDVTTVADLTVISSNQNVIVVQYAKGLYSDYKTGDPFMLIIPPTNFFSNNITFPVTSIPSNAVPQNAYMNVIVRCEDNLDIAWNGDIVDEWVDRLNDGGEFCVLRRRLGVGVHSVGHRSKSATFVVVVYGFVWRASYGYVAGFNLHDIRPTTPAPTTEAPTPEPFSLPQESIVYPDSSGTEFVFAFPTPTSSMRSVYLLITTLSTDPFQVSVTVLGIEFETSVTVSRNNYANLTLPEETILRMTESGFLQRTVRINAEARVSVYAVCGGRTTIDAFIVLPRASYGNQYVVASYEPLTSYGHASQFSMSAMDTITRINITTAHAASEVIQLQPYETYQYRDAERDLTGTRIQSDNAVSVMTGNQCANVPTTTGKCEYLVDHLPPVQYRGRRFVLAPFLGRRSGYVFRVMTAGDSATVTLSNGDSAKISPYSYYEKDVSDGDTVIVKSTAPVMVTQYAKGCYSDYLTGDPFMMLIPPVEFYSSSITFPVTTIATSETQKQYLNIIIECQYSESIVLDGHLDYEWETITADDGFCVLRGTVSTGVHTVWHQSSEARFVVIVYGFAWRASYAYVAGFNLQEPATSPTTTPETPEKGPQITTTTSRPTQSADQRIVTAKRTTGISITTRQGGDRTANIAITTTTKYPQKAKPSDGDRTSNIAIASTTKYPQKPNPSGGKNKPLKPSGGGDKNNKEGNAAANTGNDQPGGMRVGQKFLMFFAILTVVLILLVLLALIFFWRDWRRLNHRSGSSTSVSSNGGHPEVDSKSTDGMPLEDIEPFHDYDNNPLL